MVPFTNQEGEGLLEQGAAKSGVLTTEDLGHVISVGEYLSVEAMHTDPEGLGWSDWE